MLSRRSSSSAWVGALTGLLGIALVTAPLVAVGSGLPATIPALLLFLPITLSSVLAGWKVAVPVAVIAAITYMLAFLPPVGGVSIAVTEDVLVLATFVFVAVVVGALKGPSSTTAVAPSDAPLLDDQRAMLLRGVSHDLRNPLNTIRVLSSDLVDGASNHDDGTRSRLLGLVLDESERLDRIVGNLLSVSRVQAGSLSPATSLQHVDDLIERCVRRLARLGHHDIEISGPDDLPKVYLDPVQIDQVITNLLDNALRHRPLGTMVRVAAGEVSTGGANLVEVVVSDEGPGFSGAAREQLFQARRVPGGSSSGFGLAICKAIVEAHGGTIGISDERAPRTSVRFTLPVPDGVT